MAEILGLRLWWKRWNLTLSLETDEVEPRLMVRPDCIEVPEVGGLEDDDLDRLGFR